jgi:hypothetical protein
MNNNNNVCGGDIRMDLKMDVIMDVIVCCMFHFENYLKLVCLFCHLVA